ncbi:hypothetical protein [Lactiplantibacillus modestisalitolerans]|uniref:Uncharacterized protein n=1 Tax=Lactiplantibacillus modestisalitolerans TaxID=1457219 RepID=A0ABV5WSI2_9LACO|nr:hypothetical protein [Lactiplantibacillus modestisalitolerans]
MNEQKEMMAMLDATQNCQTVRYPLPATIDELGLRRDQQQLTQLFKKMDPDYSADIEAMVDYIVAMQRLCFNRGLNQITPESMADLMTVAFPAGHMDDEELKMMTGLAGFILHLLDDAQVIQTPNVDERYLTALEKTRPDLTADIPMETEMDEPKNPLAAMAAQGFFDCDPVVLLDEDETLFFAQPDIQGIDLNDFIETIAKKHSPLQLLAAYRLFQGENYQFSRILTADQLVNGREPSEHEIRFQLKLFWLRLRRLRTEAVLAEIKVYHQFLRFCLDNGGLTARRYAKLLKYGNQEALAILLSAPDSLGDWNSLDKESQRMVDGIFTNPNYTLNLKAARALFKKIRYQPVDEILHQPTYPLVLSKPLDQHQLDLEMQRAIKSLTLMMTDVPRDLFPDIENYKAFTLKLHKRMVQHYHRRLNRWTEESLLECLCDVFREDQWAATHPTILRFLEIYVEFLGDMGYVKNEDALYNALWHSMADYLTISENAVASKL